MSPEQRVARGNRAADMMNDELFVEVLDTMRKKVFDAWTCSPMRDKEGQYELRRMIETINAFEKNFRAIAIDGKQASLDLAHESKLKKLARRII